MSSLPSICRAGANRVLQIFSFHKPILTKASVQNLRPDSEQIMDTLIRTAIVAIPIFAVSFTILGPLAPVFIYFFGAKVNRMEEERSSKAMDQFVFQQFYNSPNSYIETQVISYLLERPSCIELLVNDPRFTHTDSKCSLVLTSLMNYIDNYYRSSSVTKSKIDNYTRILKLLKPEIIPKPIFLRMLSNFDCQKIIYDWVKRDIIKPTTEFEQFDVLSNLSCLVRDEQIGKTIKLLVKKGINIDAKNPQGKTALEYAIEKCDGRKVTILVQYGAKVPESSDTASSSTSETSLPVSIPKAIRKGELLKANTYLIPTDITKFNLLKIWNPAVHITKQDLMFQKDSASLFARTMILAYAVLPTLGLVLSTIPALVLGGGIVSLYAYYEYSRATKALYQIGVEELKNALPKKAVLKYFTDNPKEFNLLATQNPGVIKTHNKGFLEALCQHDFLYPVDDNGVVNEKLPMFIQLLQAVKDDLTIAEQTKYFFIAIRSGWTPLIQEFSILFPNLVEQLTSEEQYECWASVKNQRTIELLKEAGLDPNAKNHDGHSILYDLILKSRFKLRYLSSGYVEGFEVVHQFEAMVKAGANLDEVCEGKILRQSILTGNLPTNDFENIKAYVKSITTNDVKDDEL